VRVWKGKSDTIALGVGKDIFLTIPRGTENDLVAKANVDQIIEAPIVAGQELGNVVVTLDGKELLDTPIVALSPVEKAGIFSRIIDAISLFFHRLFN
jgi:D-alanyl-D-alanine carboxypeptidase (penicillin-binding protein 5/6)